MACNLSRLKTLKGISCHSQGVYGEQAICNIHPIKKEASPSNSKVAITRSIDPTIKTISYVLQKKDTRFSQPNVGLVSSSVLRQIAVYCVP